MKPSDAHPFTAILFGDESLTIACGDLLLSRGHRISSVVTRDAQVEAWAANNELRVLADPGELISEGVRADWLLSIANLRMIAPEVLACAIEGAINFHDGPLPAYAGLNTPAWAIINGETSHGVTWHLMEQGADTGDIIARERIEIAEDETAFSLNSKCYAAGMESFPAVLAQLEGGSLSREAQDLSGRRYFGRADRPANGGLLDPAEPAEALDRLVRGLDHGDYWNPLGLPKLLIGERVFLVGSLTILDRKAAAGEVLEVTKDSVTLGTATWAVRLEGLRCVAEDGVSIDELVAVGRTIIAPEPLPAVPANDEKWRRALESTEMLQAPLVKAGSAGTFQTIALNASGANDEATIAAATALVLLRSAGVERGVIGVKHEAAGPLDADWVPLALEVKKDSDIRSFLPNLETQLEQIRSAGGMASDLPFRLPVASRGQPPAVAISFDGTELRGSALTVNLATTGPALHYDSSRISPEAAGLLAARLAHAFGQATAGKTCAEIAAIPPSESALFEEWNRTDAPFDRITMQAAFEAQVRRTPDATALIFEDESLTYAELNAQANRLAHVLIDAGVGPGMPVGLCLQRGLNLMIGALAILKAGGAYVPVDPAYPADRIAHYLSDSAATVLVTETTLEDQLPDQGAQVIRVDDIAGAETAADNPDLRATPDDLAYLIYTSGSTGQPKGVMVSHANVANFFAAMDACIPHREGDTLLAATSLSFDISVLELFWTTARGFRVVIAGDESRTMGASAPRTTPAGPIDFNLMYWGNDDGVGPKKYELLLEGAKFADAHGFNAVWTPERHFHAFGGPYPNPSVTGAAVAAVTKNLAVRAGSCVAPLHHPARIAEEWAVIDNLTNGRVGLAIASGWQPDDFVLRPANTPPGNKPAMFESIRQLRALWSGEAVAFPKQDGTPHAVVTQPRPVSGCLPIWVTTAGNPQTWKEAGAIGANVLTHLLGQTVEEVGEKIKLYHAALREAGHDPADFTVTVMLHSYLAESREIAQNVARAPMKDYLRSAAGLIKQYAWAFPAFKRPEGTTNAFDLDLDGLSEEEMDAILDFAFERYFNESGLFGTVEDGLARTAELQRIGVTEIACLIDYGIAPERVLESLKPLAEVLRRAKSGTDAVADHSLAALIRRHGVTHLQCTPSMAQMLIADDDTRAALSAVKHLLIGGEALPNTLADQLRSATGGSIRNMYGPTETTIWSATRDMTQPAEGATAPIGQPVANTTLFVLDDSMSLQPVGVEGELWIGGEGVTQGYWQREDATRDRFKDNPFGPGRLYRSGDLAFWDAQGCLHFKGRADAQVKIRGHRIEPGEIEALLAAQPGVREAVVVSRDMAGGAQLVAYVVGSSIDESAIRQSLQDQLPAIMVPAHIVQIDRMPLTPNRKIERKALPSPSPRTPSAPSLATAAGSAQKAIADVWERLLGVGGVREDDNFFALGGHSLLAVQAHREIRKTFDTDRLSITDIFRFPTLGGLAKHLDQAVSNAPQTSDSTEVSGRADTISKRRAMRAGRRRTGT
jgi:natural product biosynthesis luciferase-like monooxygenase protein